MLTYLTLNGGHRRIAVWNRIGNVVSWPTPEWPEWTDYDGPRTVTVRFDGATDDRVLANDRAIQPVYEDLQPDGTVIRREGGAQYFRREPHGIGCAGSAMLTATALCGSVLSR